MSKLLNKAELFILESSVPSRIGTHNPGGASLRPKHTKRPS